MPSEAKNTLSDISPQDIIECWFGVGPDNASTLEQRFSQWFSADTDPDFDEALRRRFGGVVVDAQRGRLADWSSTARGCLALVLLFDQLPRNIYRGTKQAFAFDHLALAITTQGIERGFDLQLTILERLFFYIPFEHAEDPHAQTQCNRHYHALNKLAGTELKGITQKCVAGSAEHQAVIRRFGRFPQRNFVLGRDSTAQELAWLDQHHGWGQKRAK